MTDQPRDHRGRFDSRGSAESDASITAGLSGRVFSAAAERMAQMDRGADPRQHLDDEDTLVRISAAARCGIEVKPEDTRVAAALAA